MVNWGITGANRIAIHCWHLLCFSKQGKCLPHLNAKPLDLPAVTHKWEALCMINTCKWNICMTCVTYTYQQTDHPIRVITFSNKMCFSVFLWLLPLILANIYLQGSKNIILINLDPEGVTLFLCSSKLWIFNNDIFFSRNQVNLDLNLEYINENDIKKCSYISNTHYCWNPRRILHTQNHISFIKKTSELSSRRP